MELPRADRKLLWGKAANRCAICRRILSRPGGEGDPEIVVGEEAHIVGEKPGAARYRPLPATERDGYANRVLLCPTDHTEVDKQPRRWPEERLREVKAHHERTMALRTAEARRQGGIEFEDPGPIALTPVISGGQLARMMGEALAYTFECSELEGSEERIAAELFQSANDWGDIYGDVGPSGHADAAEDLGEQLAGALAADLILLGDVVEMNVRTAGTRDRWPVAVLWMRRAADFAAEVKEREAAA
jgi:hypothetical protein